MNLLLNIVVVVFDGYKLKGCVGIARQFIDEQMEIKKNSKGAQRFIAKRQLNSVYGKFATNPNVTPNGEFVTAYARKYTITTDQKVGIHRVAYIDTDSIHLVGTQVPDAIKDIKE